MTKPSTRNWQAGLFGFLKRPSVLPIVGLFLGPLVSWSVFSVSTLKGVPLVLVGGSVTGLIIGLLMALYFRRAETLTLSEVTITVPEFAQMKFAVNSEYRRVAWKLFIETLTRVATQPLGTEHGSLREAISSLHRLFTDTRELLKTMHPSKPTAGITVEVCAVKMLNHEIRPFLSRWHVRLQEFESRHNEMTERDWPDNATCRKELEALRDRLISYTRAFGELGGLKNTESFLAPPNLANR
jgi:hypothetical protein